MKIRDEKKYAFNNKGDDITSKYYEYIEKNISYIKKHPQIVNIAKLEDSYIIYSNKPFSPLNSQFQIFQDIKLRWKAIVSRSGIVFALLSEGKMQISLQNLEIILDEEFIIVLNKTERINRIDEYSVSLEDFEEICHADIVQFTMSLFYHFEDFHIYTRRFYNMVLDRAKYIYATNLNILTN